MSLFGQTLVLYLVIGVGVATAIHLAGGPRHWFRVATAVPFWPLYVPVLLTPRRVDVAEMPVGIPPPQDDWAAAIARVDDELAAALGSLDGWAEDVLARERGRIRDLRSAWLAQARRIREMDRLLGRPESADAGDDPSAAETDDRLRTSRAARRQNLDRLRALRKRAADDLAHSLAWVRQLVSMIHLAKFGGAPAARAEELVAQIAAAVEGLSESTGVAEDEAGESTRPAGTERELVR
jgi:hypothetical protein